MFAERVAIMAPGVIYCSTDGYRAVIAADATRALVGVVRLSRGNKHRGDVPLSDEDRHAVGLMPGNWVIRVEGAQLKPQCAVSATGVLPPRVLEQVGKAAHRAQVARQTEERAKIRVEVVW